MWKRLICFFRGHVWGQPYEVDRTFHYWWAHDCQRCGIDEGLPNDMWDDLYAQKTAREDLKKWQAERQAEENAKPGGAFTADGKRIKPMWD